MKASEQGLTAEKMAAWYLEQKGYRILETRFRIRQGEIDIIAVPPIAGNLPFSDPLMENTLLSAQILVFVEVKYRRNLDYGRPSQWVDQKKRNRIIKAAKAYLVENQLSDQRMRFDVIEIWQEDGHHKIHHYPNAFGENI